MPMENGLYEMIVAKKANTHVPIDCPWESMLNGLCRCDSIRNDRRIGCSRIAVERLEMF